MKTNLPIALLAFVILCSQLLATTAVALEQHPSCDYCGMSRNKFAHSRMLIDYRDGSSAASCSLHCSAVEFAVRIDKTPEAILVGDYQTHRLIDAEQAVWVLGGKQPGVMTARAKWAFAERTAAENFVQEHGGELIDFDTAITSAYQDMYQDTHMIRKKRLAKKMQQGR